jgi:hypothetical protein
VFGVDFLLNDLVMWLHCYQLPQAERMVVMKAMSTNEYTFHGGLQLVKLRFPGLPREDSSQIRKLDSVSYSVRVVKNS